MAGITDASNVLMTEATSSAATTNANAIVRKSELLSGLSASAPFTISMKSPNEGMGCWFFLVRLLYFERSDESIRCYLFCLRRLGLMQTSALQIVA